MRGGKVWRLLKRKSPVGHTADYVTTGHHVDHLVGAEPALWPAYGGWLASREPMIWQEILIMAAQQKEEIVLQLGPLADYLVKTDGLDRFVDSVGVERFWAALSPQKREELLQVAQRSSAGERKAPNGA